MQRSTKTHLIIAIIALGVSCVSLAFVTNGGTFAGRTSRTVTDKRVLASALVLESGPKWRAYVSAYDFERAQEGNSFRARWRELDP